MTRAEIETSVVQALTSVAPEAGSTTLQTHAPLRDQVDLDSMDFLRFVMELHRRFGVEIPEADYQKLGSVANVVDYLAKNPAAGN
jgi:acyl carrier protein